MGICTSKQSKTDVVNHTSLKQEKNSLQYQRNSIGSRLSYTSKKEEQSLIEQHETQNNPIIAEPADHEVPSILRDNTLRSILKVDFSFQPYLFSSYLNKELLWIHRHYIRGVSIARGNDNDNGEKYLMEFVIKELAKKGWYCIAYEYVMRTSGRTKGKGDLIFYGKVCVDGKMKDVILAVETKVLTGRRFDYDKRERVIEQAHRYRQLCEEQVFKSNFIFYSIPIWCYKGDYTTMYKPYDWTNSKDIDLYLPSSIKVDNPAMF